MKKLQKILKKKPSKPIAGEAEAKTMFMDLFKKFNEDLGDKLGKGKYACYLNLVWKPDHLEEDKSFNTSVISAPSDEDSSSARHQFMEILSGSLLRDPYIARAVLYNVVETLVLNINGPLNIDANTEEFTEIKKEEVN